MKERMKYFAFSLVTVLALFGVFALAKPAREAQAAINPLNNLQEEQTPTENEKYIEFTPVANYTGNYTQVSEYDTILLDSSILDSSNDSTTFTVVYKITHNYGINSILLVPEYDTKVFELTGALVDDKTSLGLATMPYEGEGFDKILLESETLYSGLNEAFMTLTFTIKAPADGVYQFGLLIANPVVHNESTEAYRWLDGTSLGEQEAIEVRVNLSQSAVRILTIKKAEIEIGHTTDLDYYAFTYAKEAVSVLRSESIANDGANLKVEYTYSGTAEPIVKWYQILSSDPEVVEELENAPSTVGDYYIGVSAPAHGIYSAVSEVRRHVRINHRPITISIDNKTSMYKTDIVPLTWSITEGSVCVGDSLNINLVTTATNESSVGSYTISISGYDSQAFNYGNYRINYTNANYEITRRVLTVSVNSGSSKYTGVEITSGALQEVGYTSKYKDNNANASSITNTLGIRLVKEVGTNVGTYEIDAVVDYPNNNYTVEVVKGVYTIESITDYNFAQHFTALEVTYNATEQNLLQVSNLPSWLEGTYAASNNLKTNAGTYQISITITLSQETANNYNGGVTQVQLAVENAKINQYPLIITADNKGHTYGSTPALLTPQEVQGAGSEKLNVTLTTIELSATTPVGDYAIVPSVVNSNYSFTFVNGTYTVSKGTVTLNVSAQDVDYNRDLNYSISGSLGTLALPEYSVVFTNANNSIVDSASVLDAGEYTITVSVADAANYNGAVAQASFSINKVNLANTTVSYNKATASWTAVTKDSENKDLYNSIVSYKISKNNEPINIDGLSYTANSTDSLKLIVESSNANYNGYELVLASVLLVEYSEGVHAATSDHPTNMPSAEYLFSGQRATSPQTNPTLTGYTFNQWQLNDQTYNFDLEVTSNLVIVAKWNIIQYTITFKYTDASKKLGTDMFEVLFDFNSAISSTLAPSNPTKESIDNPGIYYTFNNKWLNGELYQANGNGNLAANNEEYKVLDNATFVAQYDTNYNSFSVTYYVRENGGSYSLAGALETEVLYLSPVTYEELSSNIPWFTASAWYLDQALSQAVPQTMPNHDISVYAEVRFSIGQGDVNASGSVDANDITLYRQYIVGGYNIDRVQNGDEWTTANAYDENAHYFLERVADNNKDSSRDIRDISITRMAIVGGYSWAIEDGVNVPGESIVRNIHVSTLNALVETLTEGKRAKLTSDITESLGVINISASGSLYLDLNGYTLTVKSLSLVETGYATITVKNGTIVTEDGITLSAASGNVVISDVAAYDKDGEINLQAASHSLHLSGNVEFRHGNKEVSTPAAVKVEQGTHVVVEKEATLVVEKLVVTESFKVPTTVNQLVITLDYFGDEEIEVEGVVGGYTLINTLSELYEAAIAGGKYQLNGDFSFSGLNNRVYVYNDMVLDLNGHTVTSTNEIPFAVVNHATLVIEGEGQVNGVESCVMAFGASEFIINGGTYTCTDNFVFGTNGSSGQGGNSITINNGIFNGGIKSAGYVACGIYVANDDTVTVNGGIFNISNGVGILSRCGNTTVNGGTFNVTGNGTEGKVGDSRVVVPSGKVLVLDLAAHYPANKPSLVNNSAYAVYTIVSSDSELREALGYDHLGVVLVNDINCGDNDIVVSKTHNIDLNGHNITFTNWGFEVRSGATLTFDDSKGTGSVSSVEAALYAQYGGHLVVNAGTYNATNNFVIGTHGSNGSGNTITINGGTFNGSITSAGYVACGIYVANDDTVTVNGGTFNITNGVGILSRSGNTTIGKNVVINATGDNNTLGKIGDSRVVLPSGAKLVLDLAAGYPGGTPELTNNTTYEVSTLVAASTKEELNAALAADELHIVLTNNINYGTSDVVVTKSHVLNLNGHSITFDKWGFEVRNNATLTFMDGVGTGSVTAYEAALYAQYGGHLVVNGGTFTATNNFVIGTHGSEGRGHNTITINGGTFIGSMQSTDYVACGIYVANDDTVTVNGGTFNITHGVGILARSGNTTVNGGTFNVTGDNTLGQIGDSRVVLPTGKVLVLDLAAHYPGGTPTIVNNTEEYSVYTVPQAS